MSAEGGGAVRVLRAAGRRAAPWSNGGGVTREVAVRPPGADWGTFDWRVSLADVTRDGPYSPLPGIRRILTVVDGAGTELTVDGHRHLLTGRHRPYAFPGGAPTEGRLLAGPIVNLNVMVREGRATATVELLDRPREVAARLDQDMLVVALEGPAEVRARDGAAAVRLERFDAAWLPGPGGAALRTKGIAALISLTAAPAGAGTDGARTAVR